ncbi:hypothetical protein TNCV_4867001 [Trichonephila clavipes]|nr:hypothetical protein TNCV_4867001 [Trichonephila clavipes]
MFSVTPKVGIIGVTISVQDLLVEFITGIHQNWDHTGAGGHRRPSEINLENWDKEQMTYQGSLEEEAGQARKQ